LDQAREILRTDYLEELSFSEEAKLARMFHESLAATADMAALPGVLGVVPCGVPFTYASDPPVLS